MQMWHTVRKGIGMPGRTRKPVSIGERFGRLEVLCQIGTKKNGAKIYRCKCDCGNTKDAVGAELRRGSVRSCGCLFREVQLKTVTKHGHSRTALYKTWKDMKRRCENETRKEYRNYGGRGITVCDEWKHDFQAFHDWAMANGYSDELTIDRINVNGNYEPSNCRWATQKMQSNNKRTSVFLEKDGETHTVAEWAEILGISPQTIYSRLKRGCPVEKVLESR